MKNSVYVANAFFKTWLRSRSGLFFSIIFPVLLLAVFGSIFGNTQNISFTVYVQNKDLDQQGNATQLSSAFIKSLNDTGIFSVKTIPSNVDALSFARSQGGIFEQRRVIVIPRGFQSYLLNYSEKAKLEEGIAQLSILLNSTYLNDTQKQEISLLLSYMKTALQKIKLNNVSLEIYISKADPSYEQFMGFMNNFISKFGSYSTGNNLSIPVNEVEIGIRPISASDYYVPSYIAFTIMSNALFGLTGVISDLRRRGIFKRVVATPLRKYEWIFGVFLSQLILIAISSVILLITGYFVFKTTVILDPLHILLTLIGIILGTFCFTTIGTVLGTVFKQPDTAATVGSVIAFPMMFLSGVFFPVEVMPSYLQAVAAILPLYYLSVGLRESMIQGVLALTPVALIILGVLSVVFLALSLYLTKWG
ncbi:MAG TPA: ABC transporter permease, partial [Geobacterales bacterium]|nr:ABC transporter permease [Geobacterales bacterium]